jgi:hypothetical protein
MPKKTMNSVGNPKSPNHRRMGGDNPTIVDNSIEGLNRV